jgi:hypothetical protein
MMNDDVRQSNLMAHSPPHFSFLLWMMMTYTRRRNGTFIGRIIIVYIIIRFEI